MKRKKALPASGAADQHISKCDADVSADGTASAHNDHLLRIAGLEKELKRLKRDARRLDRLEASGGFLRGMADGKPAVRILGTDEWLPDLRTAVDALDKRPPEEDE